MRVWIKSFQKVLLLYDQKKFLRKIKGINNAEFHADLKSAEKNSQ